MNGSPADLTIFEAGRALRSAALSAVDLTRAHLARIAARDPSVGAFVHLAPEPALDAAQAADAALAAGRDLGPLHGIPFAIKDVFDVAGWPVRWGSRHYGARVASGTASAVQSMLDAGAVPLGLVATYELATVGPDATALYPQPRNPWNPAHVTGGSSSGAAAAVAAGLVRIALGTDTGGSVRSPAAYCGVVGLKPSRDAISLRGVMPLAPSLDHVGPIARTVPEARAAFAVLSGRDVPVPPAIAGLRIGFVRDWCSDPDAHRELLGLLDAAASVFSLLGGRVSLCALPDYAPIERLASRIILAEEYASHGATLDAVPDGFGAMARQSILSGAAITPGQRRNADRALAEFAASVEHLFTEHDILLLPTTLAPAPAFSAFADGTARWTAMRTIPFNATGHPALSVPAGLADGLPLGLQLVGRRGDEATVLRAGAAFEAATDHSLALNPVTFRNDTAAPT